MSNLANMSVEELVAAQQENSVKRADAEAKFREKGQAIQYELDKRAFKARLGTAPSKAELEALKELQEEAKKRDVEAAEAAESEDES